MEGRRFHTEGGTNKLHPKRGAVDCNWVEEAREFYIRLGERVAPPGGRLWTTARSLLLQEDAEVKESKFRFAFPHLRVKTQPVPAMRNRGGGLQYNRMG